MRKFVVVTAVLLGACLANASAQAENWMYRRSYYSHDPVSDVRIGRQYAPGPIYTRPQGVYAQSGYRYLRSQINVGGQTVDQLNHWENWISTGAQY